MRKHPEQQGKFQMFHVEHLGVFDHTGLCAMSSYRRCIKLTLARIIT